MARGRYEAEQELERTGFLSTETEYQIPLPTPTPMIPTATPIPARDLLQVELVKVGFSPDGYVVTELYLYNPAAEPITLYPDDIRIAFSNQPNLLGSWQPATGFKEITLLPQQVLNWGIIWRWDERMRFATLEWFNYRFDLELQ